MSVQLPLGVFDQKTTWKPPSSFPSLRDEKHVYIDLETYDPHLTTLGPGGVRKDGYIIGVAVGTDTWSAYYPIRHAMGNMDRRIVMTWLAKELCHDNPKIGANILYDIEWLKSEGITVKGPLYDVQTAEALLDENQETYRLADIDKRHGGVGKIEDRLNEVLRDYGFTGDNAKVGLRELPASDVGPYAEGDIDATRRVWLKQKPLLEKDGLMEVFDLECRLLPLLIEMRFKGVRVDQERAVVAAKAVAAKEQELMLGLMGDLGTNKEVDIWSAADLGKACDKLGVPYPKTDKTGAPSFKKDWLKAQPHPFLQNVQTSREYYRLRTTFLEEGIIKGAFNGRIHCQFHPMRRSRDGEGGDGTRSGRMSCTNPNLQQVSARSVLSYLVRGCYCPEEGEEWQKADYSQQEPRALVHFACIQKLRGAQAAKDYYLNDPNADFHQMVADMAGISRKEAKTINLALMYGMGIKKLAGSLGISLEEAMALRAQYFDRIPFVKQLSYQCSDKAADRGWIRTLSGRRRHFNLWEPQAIVDESFFRPLPRELAEAMWPNASLKRSGVHKALNALIQGTAADITKKAMVQIWEKYGYVPLLQVHDELGYSVRDRYMAEQIAFEMENTYAMQIPMVVEWSLKANWS